MSITCLPFAFDRHSSNAAANVAPFGWMMKSTWQVVPPNAAEVCPDSTSSIVTLPPNLLPRSLLAARRDLDLRLLPALAVDVDVLLLQRGDGGLGDVGAIGVRRRLLDHVELLRDPRRARER